MSELSARHALHSDANHSILKQLTISATEPTLVYGAHVIIQIHANAGTDASSVSRGHGEQGYDELSSRAGRL